MTDIRIVLADDHGMVRGGLKILINGQPDMEVTGEAANGADAAELIFTLQPDVAIVDINMPVMNGLELMARLSQSDSRTKVIALTANEDRAFMQQMLKLGAAGYLLKRSAADELIHAIRAVSAGRQYIDPQVVHEIISIEPADERTQAALSDRELEVMRLVAQGYAHKEIAAMLDIGVKSVETYKSRSMTKLGLNGRSEIVRYAISQGWLKDD